MIYVPNWHHVSCSQPCVDFSPSKKKCFGFFLRRTVPQRRILEPFLTVMLPSTSEVTIDMLQLIIVGCRLWSSYNRYLSSHQMLIYFRIFPNLFPRSCVRSFFFISIFLIHSATALAWYRSRLAYLLDMSIDYIACLSNGLYYESAFQTMMMKNVSCRNWFHVTSTDWI